MKKTKPFIVKYNAVNLYALYQKGDLASTFSLKDCVEHL